jgi:DNA-directed RNA polymerase subunit RPC12/RpoP
MGELKRQGGQGNVNVTLAKAESVLGGLSEKEFPCPLCGAGLPILASKRNKPYITCNSCGLQLFFRGKEGISRLREMANLGILVSGKKDSAMRGITLFNRLEQLRLQKKDLQRKQGIFLVDKSVENAVQIVDAEIEKVEGELAKIAKNKEREK